MKNRMKMWMIMLFVVLAGVGVSVGTISAEAKKKTINVYAAGKGAAFVYAVKSGRYIYYTGAGMNIMQYDTKSKKVKTLVKLKGSGTGLTKKGKYLYYTDTGYDKNNKYYEKAAGIHRCSLSGKNVIKLGSADIFVIKKNRIYYETFDEKTYKSVVMSMSLDGSDNKKEGNVKFKYTEHGTISSSYGKLSAKGVDNYDVSLHSVTLTVKNKKNGKTSTVYSGKVIDIDYVMAGDYIVYNCAFGSVDNATHKLYVQKVDGSKKKLVSSGKVY